MTKEPTNSPDDVAAKPAPQSTGKRVVRSVLAFVVGYFITMLMVTLLQVLIALPMMLEDMEKYLRVLQGQEKISISLPMGILSLSADVIAAFLGGYVFVWIAGYARIRHGLAFAAFFVIGCLLTIPMDQRAGLPLYISVGRTILAPSSVLLAAFVCEKRNPN